MTQKTSSETLNTNVANTVNEMNNTLELLYNKGLVYFYNPVSPKGLDDNRTMIPWNNHESSRSNSGKAFTTMAQYQHILETNSFHGIMYDGSIIRSSFTFKKNKLINHNHLWWPSPFNLKLNESQDLTPSEAYLDFLTTSDWNTHIRMRSPIRIDFDPDTVSDIHPPVHMHTQHHECRMKLEDPICFNRFIKYIFSNYYPDREQFFTKLNFLSFTIEKPKKINYTGTNILYKNHCKMGLRAKIKLEDEVLLKKRVTQNPPD